MEEYFCHKCSVELGHLNTGSTEHINFTGSSYQLDKFIKHTLPPSQSGLISIYSDPSYGAYKDYIVNTMASGSTMFDQFHRKNVIWYASKENGVSYLGGIPHSTTDVVKVVLSHMEEKIHSYPVNSSELITKKCKRCNTNVLTGGTSQYV